MYNKTLKPGICKASDGTEISPISSAKTSFVDNGVTVYDSLKNINIVIEDTAKIEILDDFENTDVDIDNNDLSGKLDEALDKLENIDYNITNNTNIKLKDLEKKIDNINSDIGETFDLEGSSNSGSLNAKLNKIINDNKTIQNNINNTNLNIGTKTDIVGSTTDGTIYGKLNNIISSILDINTNIGDLSDNTLSSLLNNIDFKLEQISDIKLNEIKTLLGTINDNDSVNSIFGKLYKIINNTDNNNTNLDHIKGILGTTADSNGTNNSGSINSKINKLLTDYTESRANKIDTIYENINYIKDIVDKLYKDSQNISKYYFGNTYVGNDKMKSIPCRLSTTTYYGFDYKIFKNKYMLITYRQDSDTSGTDNLLISCYNLKTNKFIFENKDFNKAGHALLRDASLYNIDDRAIFILTDVWNYSTSISELVDYDTDNPSLNKLIFFGSDDSYGKQYDLANSKYHNKKLAYINRGGVGFNSYIKLYTFSDLSQKGTLTTIYTFREPDYQNNNIGTNMSIIYMDDTDIYVAASGLIIEENNDCRYPSGIYKLNIELKELTFLTYLPTYETSYYSNTDCSDKYVFIITNNKKIILFSKETFTIDGIINGGDNLGILFKDFNIVNNIKPTDGTIDLYSINKIEY